MTIRNKRYRSLYTLYIRTLYAHTTFMSVIYYRYIRPHYVISRLPLSPLPYDTLPLIYRFYYIALNIRHSNERNTVCRNVTLTYIYDTLDYVLQVITLSSRRFCKIIGSIREWLRRLRALPWSGEYRAVPEQCILTSVLNNVKHYRYK